MQASKKDGSQLRRIVRTTAPPSSQLLAQEQTYAVTVGLRKAFAANDYDMFGVAQGYAEPGISRRQSAITVTSPAPGDTITVADSILDSTIIPIRWNVPSDLADRPVIISLVQGSNPNNLSTTEVVSCE
jgi:hypothetical protein